MRETARTAHEFVDTDNLWNECCVPPMYRGLAYAFTYQEFNPASAPSEAYGWGFCHNQLGHLPGAQSLRMSVSLELSAAISTLRQTRHT